MEKNSFGSMLPRTIPVLKGLLFGLFVCTSFSLSAQKVTGTVTDRVGREYLAYSFRCLVQRLVQLQTWMGVILLMRKVRTP